MTSEKTSGLTNHFLISTPKLNDGIFNQSVVYICEHNENGTMGLKINHTLPFKLDEMLSQLDIVCNNEPPENTLLLDGGPVNTQQGFILHETKQQDWESCLQITENVYITTSKDILYAIAEKTLKGRYLVALGYSGWSPGQIEDELKENVWMTIPASQDTLFEHNKNDIWQHCVDQLGFDLNQLSNITGNA